jgi:ribosomal protein L7Ae-like RNA K-turn-binding protein
VDARAELVAQASKKGLFTKGLKEKIEAGPELVGTVDRLLETDCLQMLALANKGGAVINGFNKVVEALEKGNVIGLVAAWDGGADGKRKLRQFARRCGLITAPIVGIFRSNQLDLALGRTNVIHAALVKGGACQSFLERCQKLAGYRGLPLEGDTLGNLNDRRINVTAAQLDVVDEENYRAGSGAGSEAG